MIMVNQPVTLRSRLRQIRWRYYLVVLLVCMTVVIATNVLRTRDVPATAPDFSGYLANGMPVSLADFRARHPGQPVALHFWADWCPICRVEQKSISRLVRDPDVAVLTVAMQSGNEKHVTKTLTSRELDWPVVIDENGAITGSFGLRAVPAFVIIDADGAIYSVQIGYTSEIGMRLRLWLARRNLTFPFSS